MSPKDLVNEAVACGISTLVLTDINNTSCAFQFIEACKIADIKPIIGVEFRNEKEFLYLGIAKNNEGWKELCQLLTECSLSEKELPQEAPELNNCYIIYRKVPKGLHTLRDNEYIGVRPEEVNQLFSSYLKDYLHKLVVFAPVTFKDEDGYKLHKLLRCIDLNIVLTRLKPEDSAKGSEMFRKYGEIKELYNRYPVILQNTQKIISSCSVSMESSHLHNRKTFTGDEKDDMKLLTKLAMSGCERRYASTKLSTGASTKLSTGASTKLSTGASTKLSTGASTRLSTGASEGLSINASTKLNGKYKKALERTKKELSVIDKMGFCAYFLITWDIIRYAHSVGYHHVGRGSGANSIVAYNINITDVDPLELDLYFERFINPYRSSPPDFDIDFSWDERDDVTDYIFKRYGKEHTALLATYNTFKGKSIIRELGKVIGLPKADIDVIVDEPLASEKHHPFAKHIFRYGKMMEDFPNYLSIHAGGILISEKPLNYHTALQLMPKGFPIVHFDMYGAEDLGFHKYDVLSQRGLGHIKDAVDLVKRNQGRAIDIHNVAEIKEDPKVKAQLKSGHCIGCFYIESPAMRGLLTKLHCDTYVHLVAASSIIRPGVAKSGMMREYIQRFHKPDSFTYLHPTFEEHLGETFGVMVYQEDVMKIVHHFAGLDMDESDILRRIMTGKKKNSDTFRNLQEKFFRNCKERGYTDELSMEVWRQVESFSGYSFCKAHSASFAVESFQSLYLKTYYPLEFMTAVVNNFGGFYNAELYLHEARMCGAIIHAPCINNSTYLTNIYGAAIYVGFIHISQLEQKVAAAIVEERMKNGDYHSLKDFINRLDIGKEQIELLIRIGAFRFTGMNKYELMWEKNAVFAPASKQVQYSVLFDVDTEEYELPIMTEGRYEQAFDEIELLGFPLCSPFDLMDSNMKADIHADDMKKHYGKTVTMLGYYVCQKNVTTVNRKLMNFGTWLDEKGKFFDTTHFPPSLAKYPFKGKGMYAIKGKIVDDFDFPSLEVTWMEKLPFVKDERYFG